ncbi:MAG: signal peptidase II, partial [bacterium]
MTDSARSTDRKKWVVFLIVAVLSLVADQATKIWARDALPVARGDRSAAQCIVPDDMKFVHVDGEARDRPPACHGEAVPVLGGFWDWRLSMNPGSAFGLFSSQELARIGLSVVGIVAVFGMLWMLRKSRHDQRVLHWALALVAGGAAFILQQTGVLHDSGPWLFTVIAGYMMIVGVLGWRVHRAGSAGSLMVGATIAADLAFIFLSTAASSTPSYYERILILSFFVLHLTESHFGRKHAAGALAAILAGYTALVAWSISRGAPLSWPEQLWSMALFATAGGAFILQYGSHRRRLDRIVDLIHSAEVGDFTKAYDADADRSPDAITRVGRAYNRVRLQLASMVLTDPLTGCLNRRGLSQVIAREIARQSRSGGELSLLAIDLDHFK